MNQTRCFFFFSQIRSRLSKSNEQFLSLKFVVINSGTLWSCTHPPSDDMEKCRSNFESWSIVIVLHKNTTQNCEVEHTWWCVSLCRAIFDWMPSKYTTEQRQRHSDIFLRLQLIIVTIQKQRSAYQLKILYIQCSTRRTLSHVPMRLMPVKRLHLELKRPKIMRGSSAPWNFKSRCVPWPQCRTCQTTNSGSLHGQTTPFQVPLRSSPLASTEAAFDPFEAHLWSLLFEAPSNPPFETPPKPPIRSPPSSLFEAPPSLPSKPPLRKKMKKNAQKWTTFWKMRTTGCCRDQDLPSRRIKNLFSKEKQISNIFLVYFLRNGDV